VNTWTRCFQRAAEAEAPRHKYESNSELSVIRVLLIGLGLKLRGNESPEKPDLKVVNRSVNRDVLATRDGADDISPANNTDELITAHDGNAFDVMSHH
jgi:hypothetical protein